MGVSPFFFGFFSNAAPQMHKLGIPLSWTMTFRALIYLALSIYCCSLAYTVLGAFCSHHFYEFSRLAGLIRPLAFFRIPLGWNVWAVGVDLSGILKSLPCLKRWSMENWCSSGIASYYSSCLFATPILISSDWSMCWNCSISITFGFSYTASVTTGN